VLGHGLEGRNLPTARPLAVFHRRRRGLPAEGYLVQEKITDALELRQTAARLATAADGWRRRRPLVEQLARLIRHLHHCRLSHRDLKAANVLVQSADGPGPSALWFIDLVGVARHRALRRAVRVQNLARLHASFYRDPSLTRTDKLRFLRVYLQWGLHGRRGWKAWWKAIEQATLAKAARNARSGRPLS
jgi:heptose I phosphotransferase